VGHDRDLGSPIPWRRSLRAAQERRGALMRRRRRSLRSRAGLTLAVAGSALAAAGALAQEPAPPSGSAERQSAGKDGTVAAVQRALDIPADGVYGRKTRAAVRRFQRREGLTVDGVIGPRTLEALGISEDEDAASSEEPAASEDATRSESGSESAGAPSGSQAATLERIARCESGGDPTAVSADGTYRGKYQFDRATWEQLGGTGDPAQASESEQDRLAAKLLAQRGTAPWPVCGG
jgi:peptidoglycan hydrolase-like protein with peptidoglycan-binding domain